VRLDREELAYAGGLFEGEGYFTLRPGSHTPRSAAGINMTDREPLERFAAAVGMGTIIGPKDLGPHRKPMYVWGVHTRERAQALVAMLWPWLGPRRRARAKEVLAADMSLPPRPAKPRALHPRDYSGSLTRQLFGKPHHLLTRAQKNEYERQRRA
jgi:hypothetical protein